MRRFLSNMFLVPEKTFPFLQTRASAYFTLYVLPGFFLLSMLSATIIYGSAYLVWAILLVGIIYLTVLAYKGFQTTSDQQILRSAQTQELPKLLIKYFKKQHPVSDTAMMISDDRSDWVAYGHIDKYEMARLMTQLDYHLMPPPPEATGYFLDNVHNIRHAWFSIEDPIKEKFTIEDTKPTDKTSYPVTVFHRGETTS